MRACMLVCCLMMMLQSCSCTHERGKGGYTGSASTGAVAAAVSPSVSLRFVPSFLKLKGLLVALRPESMKTEKHKRDNARFDFLATIKTKNKQTRTNKQTNLVLPHGPPVQGGILLVVLGSVVVPKPVGGRCCCSYCQTRCGGTTVHHHQGRGRACVSYTL